MHSLWDYVIVFLLLPGVLLYLPSRNGGMQGELPKMLMGKTHDMACLQRAVVHMVLIYVVVRLYYGKSLL